MINENENKACSVVPDNGLMEVACQKEGVQLFSGKSRRPLSDYPRKTQARIQMLNKIKNENRKLPGHCTRCGKAHKGEYKRCDICRSWQKRYRDRKTLNHKAQLFMSKLPQLDAIEKRIQSLEISVARLQLDKHIAYNQGYRAGVRREKRKIVSQKRVMRYEIGNEFAKGCRTSAEELKQLCVGFRNES